MNRKTKVQVRRKPEPKPVKPVRRIAKIGIEVQRSKGTRTVCLNCETFPEGRRLVVKKGGGRFGKTEVYCIGCGTIVLEGQQDKLVALKHYLQSGFPLPVEL